MMSKRRLLPCLLAVLPPLAGGALAQTMPTSYDEAKVRADYDEAELPTDLATRIHQAQATALDEGVAQCATPQANTAPFTIVVALDAQGAVTQSWRAGGTPLAICMEKFLREHPLPAPNKAPLFLAYELTFTP